MPYIQHGARLFHNKSVHHNDCIKKKKGLCSSAIISFCDGDLCGWAKDGRKQRMETVGSCNFRCRVQTCIYTHTDWREVTQWAGERKEKVTQSKRKRHPNVRSGRERWFRMFWQRRQKRFLQHNQHFLYEITVYVCVCYFLSACYFSHRSIKTHQHKDKKKNNRKIKKDNIISEKATFVSLTLH